MTTSLPHVVAGRLRPLAVTSKERASKLPEVPTVTAAGYPKLQDTFWLAVVAPAGTSPEITEKLNAASTIALPNRRHVHDLRTSAPKSRSEHRPNSARFSPTNSPSGGVLSRPPALRGNEVLAADHACLYRKPKTVTDPGESVDSSLDERFLQIDPVRPDRVVPIAIGAGGRNRRAPASAQRSSAQISEAN
jgi:Tripartite tricarboxylate transporter family receptor